MPAQSDYWRKVNELPKESTKYIQASIAKLGEDMGFLVETECVGVHGKKATGNDEHAPKFDVVWYLDLEDEYSMLPLKEIFRNEYNVLDKINKLPIAGFEIEGSSTTSKNQIGNIANLYYGDFIYKFVIVNNAEAKAGAKLEEDTYRRGLKIARYYQQMMGSKNLFFADWTQIKKSIDGIKAILNRKQPAINRAHSKSSLGSGGETASCATRKGLVQLLNSTGLIVKEDFKPQFADLEYHMVDDLLKDAKLGNEIAFLLKRKFYRLPNDAKPSSTNGVSAAYYVPKLDITCGITLPTLLAEWMKLIGNELREEIVNYPLLYALKHTNTLGSEGVFIPIVGVEIEASDNKHLIGGCVNLTSNTFIGILAAPKKCEKRYRYIMDKCGFRNIYYHEIIL